jgi:hypothetical protein
MLLRRDADGVLAIGQASHAWISGQLARAWGNERFGAVEPCEEVCLAAEQHDVGMAAWDLEPARNPATGLPYSFLELPIETHLELWRTGPRRLLSQSRYAALLVSMHGQRLYERRDLSTLAHDEADAVRAFLADKRAFHEALFGSLPQADAQALPRNSQLVWTWDSLSLALCLGWRPFALEDVPTADGPVDVSLTGPSGDRCRALEPWPFGAARVRVRCEGRRLSGPYDTDEALSTALAGAPWETIEFDLESP